MTVQPPVTTPGFVESLQAALGRQYRVEREIGRGGMGVVYLARDLTLDRQVAVKVVHPDLSTNRAVAARFLTEARSLAKLRHPNIVAVHSAGEVDGQLYYVMDFLPGETLRQRLGREPRLSPAVATRIASDIADALDAASAAGVVHRDLKPENILLDGPAEEPRALLADFGIARLVEGGAGPTGPGAVMGTPAYMSPEQAAGEEIDGRSDLYSLGVVTYEMLAGAPPFTGPHRTVISKQILDPPAPLDGVRQGLPAALVAGVMRALEKVPDARWPNGRAFRRAITGEEITPTPSAATLAPSRRRRFVPAIVGGLVIAALALVALLVRDEGPPRGVNPRHSILVLPFTNVRSDPTIAWLRDGSVNMLSLALSQWHDLTVVDQDRVHDLLNKAGDDTEPIGLDLARRLARESKVWTVVLGDYTRVGDSLHLVARRYDVQTGKRLDLVQVAGTITDDDVRPLFDELAARLLDLTGAPKTDRASLTSVTTGSLEAYRAYLRGIDALSHWRLAEASRALLEAVRIDSTFSLANYKLAIARGWISPVDTIAAAAIRRAARTSERLPARDRSLIEGYRTFVDGDYDRGMTIYGELLRKDSADVDAWYGLADAAFHGGYATGKVPLLSRSLDGFRRLIGLDSTFALAYEHVGALLNDAGAPRGWLVLVGDDSLIQDRDHGTDSAEARARQAAVAQAIDLARAWTRLQPSTPRAHYHLYKSYLSGSKVGEARQTLGQLRGLYPDSVQAFFGLLDARAQFVGHDVAGAARTLRAALPLVRPSVFAELDFAPEPLMDMMTGVDALGYVGDVQSAVDLIRLGREMRRVRPEERDSVEKQTEDDLWEIARLGTLYGATGTRTDRLRTVWNRGIAIAKSTPPEYRGSTLSAITPAAIGLLLGPEGDPTAVAEVERLTSEKSPAVVRALVASRAGDSVGARRLLAEADTGKRASIKGFAWDLGVNDTRPIRAETYFELADYAKVVEVLADFQPGEFGTRGFDARWIILPRVRLLRGQALEKLGRGTAAAVEYQAVVAQWSGADPELLPVVQQARQRLAVVAGTPEAS